MNVVVVLSVKVKGGLKWSSHSVEWLQRQRDSGFDAERLASARRRLQENYKEAENGGIFVSIIFIFML